MAAFDAGGESGSETGSGAAAEASSEEGTTLSDSRDVITEAQQVH